MSKPLPLSDFRARRMEMEQSDFGYAPHPRPAPVDLVDKATWDSIIGYPCDVSIVTTSQLGSIARELHQLWGAWIEATPIEDALWKVPMLDIGDEFQSATFAWLHGYYRLALTSLRSALEAATIAAAVMDNPSLLDRWQSGKEELGFGWACGRLLQKPEVVALEAELAVAAVKPLFLRNGWIRSFYSALCMYSHSRPKHTASALWSYSNGPIYSDSAAKYVAKMWRYTCAACWVTLNVFLECLAVPSALGELVGATEQAGPTLQTAWRFVSHIVQ